MKAESALDLYPYALGDALSERRRYNYAPYAARPFLAAWTAAREPLRKSAPADPLAAPPLGPSLAGLDDALDALAQAWRNGAGANERQRLRRLIQHFEVGQRIYGAYAVGFVPLDRSDCRDPDRYLLAAELFESSCTEEGALDALNALLKIMDLLTTQRAWLSAEQAARLQRLAQRESGHVQRLAQRLGVSW